MALKSTLKARMVYRIKRGTVPVFVPGDFTDLSGYDQVGRVLRQLVREGFLIKIGQGLYTRAKQSALTGRPTLEKPLPELARDALQKLGVEVTQTQYEKAYAEKRSTQVPTGRVIGVKGRISRKIGYNGRYISYEKAA